jgi:hypothetical protein|tara:strand:- start:281 stop:601 length:321 start_codon:yes stop_codon:yes gene_type:complete
MINNFPFDINLTPMQSNLAVVAFFLYVMMLCSLATGHSPISKLERDRLKLERETIYFSPNGNEISEGRKDIWEWGYGDSAHVFIAMFSLSVLLFTQYSRLDYATGE